MRNDIRTAQDNAAEVKKLKDDLAATRAALAATDHLYHDDGEVRTCYEYDDDREAWDEMARARNTCRAGA